MSVISIENIGKMYRIGADKSGGPLRMLSPSRRRACRAASEFWALRNVSFTADQGDVIGIIGRNGAGKSTLLKILSQITPPTEGRIVSKGRIASLLEVGTGFHPELTGRENIYINGAILGMTRRQISRRFDEICAFAEVDKFLDTPVKRYSSGMYVRLAFAVAAHLEPEILIVDEVLSVGDASFQTKCLGKMGDVAREGRTVLFVSHNMSAVSRLCNKGVVLSGGRVDFMGSAHEAVRHYTPGLHAAASACVRLGEGSSGDSAACFTGASLVGQDGRPKNVFFIGDEMSVRIDLAFREPVDNLRLSFGIRNSDGTGIYHCVLEDSGFQPTQLYGNVTFTARFPSLMLYPGTYFIDDLWLASDRATLDTIPGEVLSFSVAEGGPVIKRMLATHKAVVHEAPEWSIDDTRIIAEPGSSQEEDVCLS